MKVEEINIEYSIQISGGDEVTFNTTLNQSDLNDAIEYGIDENGVEWANEAEDEWDEDDWACYLNEDPIGNQYLRELVHDAMLSHITLYYKAG